MPNAIVVKKLRETFGDACEVMTVLSAEGQPMSSRAGLDVLSGPRDDALAKRLPPNVIALSLHPGVIITNLTRSMGVIGAIYRAVGKLFTKSVAETSLGCVGA